MQTTDFIWFDGKMVPWADAQVHVLTHALHYGSAVFEGIRAYACADGTSAVFRLKEHSQRLLNSAKILRLNIPYTVDEISQGILDTLKANKMKEGYIRPLSFVGDGEMGVYPGNNKVHTIIAVWPWGAYLGPEALEMGIRAKTSSFARMHVNTLMSKAKAAGNYVNSILAKIEAKEDGYDEAVMLDTNGFVSEATGENIFIVRDGIIKTTPWTSILGGITRMSCIELLRSWGPRPGLHRGRTAVHPRRAVHRRRSLLHRYRRRDHAHPRSGQPHHRRRPCRSCDQAPAEGILRRGQGPERQVRRLAEPLHVLALSSGAPVTFRGTGAPCRFFS